MTYRTALINRLPLDIGRAISAADSKQSMFHLTRGPSCWCDIDADEGRIHDAADGCCDCRGTVQHACRRLKALSADAREVGWSVNRPLVL